MKKPGRHDRRSRPVNRNLVLLPALFLIASGTFAQEAASDTTLREQAVKVFLDLASYYHNYVKTEVPFINYVRDRMQADVHAMLTEQPTASGGMEYTITLLGQGRFEGVSDTLVHHSRQMDTEETVRKAIVNKFKLGLMRYVSRTPQADMITIRYKEKTDPTAVMDRWKNWVFNTSLRTELGGEKYYKSYSLRTTFNADRITPDWKISLGASIYYNEDNFTIDDETLKSVSKSQSLKNLIVKSLGEHWSFGYYADAYASVYYNYKSFLNFTPAVEFNVFPYSESTRKEFRWLYRIGGGYARYSEETIYNKTNEMLFHESLSVSFELKEKWGSVNTTLIGSHYFHDFRKNRLQLFSILSLKLFEGVSLDIYLGASAIHDQLSLPKRDISDEEILLQRRELETNYSYGGSIGLRYTFGSIYSNVVNPRFGE